MSAETARHVRTCGGPLVVPPQPPPDRSLIDAVSGFINDVKLSSSAAPDPKDVIQWARFETADINEPNPEGDTCDISPLLLILGYGSGVQAWLIPPNGDAQEILSWRQGTVRVLRILPTPQTADSFAARRPLLALCDSASPGPTFCSLSFISIRGGEQVKSIKFKNPILDVLANKRSIVVSFTERFAVFDAGSLEDRMAVTTCYPCPCPLGGSAPINPLALGDRWLAYADKKLNPSKRSIGGCEGEGTTSYTATVLHAAKSLGKGLRGLGESVAQSLAGARGASPPRTEHQPGVVTIIDIEGNTDEDIQEPDEPYDPIIAHFVAHSDSILGMKFDPSGMLLVTGDKRGHDFHVFRIHPHPCGPSLASVQHLYILHRGDTTAKLQDIAISADSRWAAVSTLRGTTHVFPVAPYGGAAGVRTHAGARVVNRLSRFQRSAGLPPPPLVAHPAARSGSPIDPAYGRNGEAGAVINESTSSGPVYVTALAQLRRHHLPSNTVTRSSSGRQRLSSLSEDGNSPPLLARATFGASPAPSSSSSAAAAAAAKSSAQLSLYLMSANGTLLHLALTPRPSKSVPKEKVCEESSVELEVEGVCQWALSRPPAAADLLLPLPPASPLLLPAHTRSYDAGVSCEERWLSQVEIVTHAGPHRRLWMGPQFVFKTYTTHGSSSSLSEADTVEVGSAAARSTPVNMPNVRPILPALIHSGSNSSLEHSPVDSFRRKSLLTESSRAASVCDVQLREDLAEAMKEDHGGAWAKDAERCDFVVGGGGGGGGGGVARAVDPLGTVCARSADDAPPPPPDDAHTLANEDEARFRPVVAARAPLPAPEPRARPLPLHTTIPVQTLLHTLPHSNTPADIQPDSPKEPSPRRDQTFNNKQRSAESDTPTQPLHYKDAIESVTNVESVDMDENVVSINYRESKVNVKSNKKCKNNESKQSFGSTTDDERMKSQIDNSDSLNTVPEIINSDRCAKSGSMGPDKNKSKMLSADDKQGNKKVRGGSQPKSLALSDSNNQNEAVQEKLVQRSASPCSYSKSELVVDDVINEPERTAVVTESKVAAKEEVTIKMNKRGKEKSKDNELTNITPVTNKTIKETKNIKKSVSDLANKTGETNVVTESETANDYTDIQILPEPMPENVESSINVTVQLKPTKPYGSITKNKSDDNIRTEEQAWDMLLNETEKTVATVIQEPSAKEVTAEEPKMKSKRNRKNKKTIDESSTKIGDDSFVEIHAIEKTQECAGDLVSIREPLPTGDYPRSATKSRSPQSATPEKIYDRQLESFDMIQEVKVNTAEDNKDYLYVQPDPIPSIRKKSLDLIEDTFSAIHLHHIEGTFSENTSFIAKEAVPRTKKCKSLSPCPDVQKKQATKPANVAKKDYIVIDTSKDEFPDIKITSGNKNRKKSPQLEEQGVIEKQPVKSWSSIAASKAKVPDEDVKPETPNVDNNLEESDKMSFQEKLVKLCKITDILVAECDAPTELTFVEEHHAIPDLPPLESLDFPLDGFKLDVMRDSLLETNESKNSPICKINIDDILSSIKDTTNKVIESSTFNLVDLEKVPKKREKGFSIVDSEIITTQEIDINSADISRKTNEEVMEKSSDDDNTSPVLSTDSDKDDKKQTSSSASAPLLKPSAAQSAKAKKSRRKKK